MEYGTSNCIVCNVNCQSSCCEENQNEKANNSRALEKIWNFFCDLFNLETSQWVAVKNYYLKLNYIPFCTECQSKLQRLSILQQKLKTIQREFTGVKTSLIESIGNTLINCDLEDLNGFPGHSSIHQDQDKEMEIGNKLTSLRQTISRDFNIQEVNDFEMGNFDLIPPIKVENSIPSPSENFPYPSIVIKQEPDCKPETLEINCSTIVHMEEEDVQFNFEDLQVEVDPLAISQQQQQESPSSNESKSQEAIKRKLTIPNSTASKRKSKKLPKLIVVGSSGNNDQDNKFEYGGWNFQKSINGFVCACGVEKKFISNMKAHIIIAHVGFQRASRVLPTTEINNAVERANGEFVYKNIWKFQQKADGQFQCETCLQLFLDKIRILKHIQNVHIPETSRFYCHECSLGFKDQEALLKHRKCHNECRYTQIEPGRFVYDEQFEFSSVNEMFNCQTCGYCSNSFDEMTTHINDVHIYPERSTCPKCNHKYDCRKNLLVHLEICNKKYKVLDEGTLMYQEKWPVEIFKNPRTLKDRFKCGTCGAERAVRWEMFQHIRDKHISTEVVNCGLCGKLVDDEDMLKSHMTQVHENQSEPQRQPQKKYYKSRSSTRAQQFSGIQEA